ncbi:hypothetical protein M3J09_000453 [Ascochyta lentis]
MKGALSVCSRDRGRYRSISDRTAAPPSVRNSHDIIHYRRSHSLPPVYDESWQILYITELRRNGELRLTQDELMEVFGLGDQRFSVADIFLEA